MIHFVVGEKGAFGIRYYLAEEGAALAPRIRCILYDEVFRLRQVPLGTYVFAEIDRLSAPEREYISIVWDRLEAASSSARLLNHPQRVLSRYELLSAARDAGVNRFRAFPASRIVFGTSGARAAVRLESEAATVDGDPIAARRQPATALRYPVFVRRADRHTGSLTPLLDSPRDLERALAGLLGSLVPMNALLVVEFCDTRDGDGIFRKYAAYRIGNRIIPNLINCSRDWVVKWEGRILGPERAREESRYLEDNPHEAWIREMFDMARVEYGRIDYGVLDGQPQVWEINTNPTITHGPGPKVVDPKLEAYKRMLSPGYEVYYRGLLAAWEELDRDTDPKATIEVRAPDSLRRAIDIETKRRARAERGEAFVDALARRPWIRPAARALRQALTSMEARRLRAR